MRNSTLADEICVWAFGSFQWYCSGNGIGLQTMMKQTEKAEKEIKTFSQWNQFLPSLCQGCKITIFGNFLF